MTLEDALRQLQARNAELKSTIQALQAERQSQLQQTRFLWLLVQFLQALTSAAQIEIRKALVRAEELSELKSRFISMASHEFRTPLSTILSSADLLEFHAGNWSAEKQREHIQRIQKAAVYMTSLLDGVIVLDQTDAGQLRFEPVPLDLLAFLQNLVADFQLNEQHNHAIVLQIHHQTINPVSEPSIPACMDETLLRQILSNLLSNALKYSPPGSTVRTTLICSENRALFQVHDAGIGIPVVDLPHLFEPFHRGENVGTIVGTGLGLTIVKQSVEAHRGQITISSEEGVGTTVTVSLPLSP